MWICQRCKTSGWTFSARLSTAVWSTWNCKAATTRQCRYEWRNTACASSGNAVTNGGILPVRLPSVRTIPSLGRAVRERTATPDGEQAEDGIRDYKVTGVQTYAL